MSKKDDADQESLIGCSLSDHYSAYELQKGQGKWLPCRRCGGMFRPNEMAVQQLHLNDGFDHQPTCKYCREQRAPHHVPAGLFVSHEKLKEKPRRRKIFVSEVIGNVIGRVEDIYATSPLGRLAIKLLGEWPLRLLVAIVAWCFIWIFVAGFMFLFTRFLYLLHLIFN